MTQERGGMIYVEPLGQGVVKLTVHGKSGIDGRSDYVELICDSDEMQEFETEIGKAIRLSWTRK